MHRTNILSGSMLVAGIGEIYISPEVHNLDSQGLFSYQEVLLPDGLILGRAAPHDT